MSLLYILNSDDNNEFKNCTWVKEMIEKKNVSFDGYRFKWEQSPVNAPEIKTNHSIQFTVWFKKSFNTRKVNSLQNKKHAFSICELKMVHYINNREVDSNSCLVLCFDGKPIFESETASITSLVKYARHEINSVLDICYLSEPQEETETETQEEEKLHKYAACPHCHKIVKISKNGTIPSHKSQYRTCEGSKKKAVNFVTGTLKNKYVLKDDQGTVLDTLETEKEFYYASSCLSIQTGEIMFNYSKKPLTKITKQRIWGAKGWKTHNTPSTLLNLELVEKKIEEFPLAY